MLGGWRERLRTGWKGQNVPNPPTPTESHKNVFKQPEKVGKGDFSVADFKSWVADQEESI
jgi:hypothetical protein